MFWCGDVPHSFLACSIWRFTYEYNEVVGLRDNLEQNPCFGPFPYRYTWNVYIWQKVCVRFYNCVCVCVCVCVFAHASPATDLIRDISTRLQVKRDTPDGKPRVAGDIRVCFNDWMDCPADARKWKISESDVAILKSKCRFQPYDEHPNDWFRFPGYRKGPSLHAPPGPHAVRCVCACLRVHVYLFINVYECAHIFSISIPICIYVSMNTYALHFQTHGHT